LENGSIALKRSEVKMRSSWWQVFEENISGNKADLKTDVDESLAKAAVDKLKELGLTYMPVSAKSG
jgi:hypothetical protein